MKKRKSIIGLLLSATMVLGMLFYGVYEVKATPNTKTITVSFEELMDGNNRSNK